MKHDPSTYIGIGKDGFLPPEHHGPFDPKESEFLSSPSLPAKDVREQSESMIFGGAITFIVIALVLYLFLGRVDKRDSQTG
ncbi:MAG: hypothetical protein IPN84_16545 [Sphingomonadales bacterium]|nr:hypothetical protein [Sphingomonadales bacterium]